MITSASVKIQCCNTSHRKEGLTDWRMEAEELGVGEGTRHSFSWRFTDRFNGTLIGGLAEISQSMFV